MITETALQSLQKLDRQHYLACLFVPEAKREAFAALLGYTAELKRIEALVSEPLPGEIRLQWWKEVISGERAGEASNHPVATKLIASAHDHCLPLDTLITIAEARVFDLYHDPMPDIAVLETYLGETEASVLQLGALILDPKSAQAAAEAAGHAGMAIGIALILQQLARKTAAQKILIPTNILDALGIKAQQIFAGDEAAQSKAVTALIALGRDHLKAFFKLGKTVSAPLRPAFLGVSLCEPIFQRAEKSGAKAFSHDIQLPSLLAPVRMAYRAMCGW